MTRPRVRPAAIALAAPFGFGRPTDASEQQPQERKSHAFTLDGHVLSAAELRVRPPSDDATLYVDRNAIGDLTEPGDRFTPKESQTYIEIEGTKYPHLDYEVPDVTEGDGKTNDKAHLPGPLVRRWTLTNRKAAPVRCSAWFGGPSGRSQAGPERLG